IGAFNTFVLICSSVTIVLCLEAAKVSQAGIAKFWMFLTLALGSVFLGIKMYEYNAKFAHGIYPMQPRSRIYEKPDVYFASAVRERLLAINGALTTKPDDEKTDEDKSRLAILDALKLKPGEPMPAGAPAKAAEVQGLLYASQNPEATIEEL